MPTYDYQCSACGHEWELFQSMNDSPVKSCPKCPKRKARRLLGIGAGLIFKGSGFYETDYKQKSGGENKEGSDKSDSKSSDGSKSDNSKSADSGTSSSADSKKEAKPEVKKDSKTKSETKPRQDPKKS